MATKIRLARGGAKKRPYYRIVVTDSRSARDCNYIEKIGTYNPLLEAEAEKRVNIDAERAKYWLSVGAVPTDRVHVFLNKLGIVTTSPAQKPQKPSKKEAKKAAA